MTRRQEIYVQRLKEELQAEIIDDDIVFLLPQELAKEFDQFLKFKNIFSHISSPIILSYINEVDLTIYHKRENINTLIEEFILQMVSREE